MERLINRRTFLYLTPLAILAGCAPGKRLDQLESRVSALDSLVSKTPSLSAEEAMKLAESTESRNMWWRNGLIGGGDALDGITHTSLADGDGAIVVATDSVNSNIYFYSYNASGTNTDNPPARIAPNSGGGAWYLCDTYSKTYNVAGEDGHYRINVSNASIFVGTPINGDCMYRKDTNQICCFNGASWGCASLVDTKY